MKGIKRCVSMIVFAAIFTSLFAVGAFAEADEPIHLVFWHGMSGTNGEIINYIVETFNESHDGIEVEAQYQGSYEESINKLKAAMRTQDGPDIVSFYGGQRFCYPDADDYR